MKAFKNAVVYVEEEGLKNCDLLFDSKIQKIGKEIVNKLEVEEITLPDDAIVLPAFIDEHIHGAGGADAMDGDVSALKTISETIAKEGTATFLATTMTQSEENILRAMQAVKDYKKVDRDESASGARVLGVHLEGPFIAAAHKGAQPLEYIVKPDIETFKKYNKASDNSIKIVTLAPEEDENYELVSYLSQHGVVPSIGHTSAKTAQIAEAIQAGAKNITHTYNAQSPLHHREIGTVGSALLYDELNCELIADTIHVSVPAIKLLVKNKPKDKITLITDAMRAKGLQDGESELGGQKVFVKNGEARLEDGTLAGSILKMNRAIENMVKKVGVSLTDAVDFATKNPAKTLGIYEDTGSIKIGKRADFVVLNGNFDVLYTIRAGKIIYKG